MSVTSRSAMRWSAFGGTDLVQYSRLRFEKKWVQQLHAHSNWQWRLNEAFVVINGETHYLWRAVDHEGEVLESYITKRRDRIAVLKFLRKTMNRIGPPHVVVTDLLRSYIAAMKAIGCAECLETRRWVVLSGELAAIRNAR